MITTEQIRSIYQELGGREKVQESTLSATVHYLYLNDLNQNIDELEGSERDEFVTIVLTALEVFREIEDGDFVQFGFTKNPSF